MKYRVYWNFACSKYIGEYEADNAEDAERMALKENENLLLCDNFSNENDDVGLTDITIEEVIE